MVTDKLLRRGRDIQTAFLDLKAAFDTVLRQHLWNAIKRRGHIYYTATENSVPVKERKRHGENRRG